MRHSTVHYRGSSSGLVYNSYIPKVNPVAVGRCPAVVWAMSRGAFGVYFDSWPLTFLHAMSYGRGNEQARLNLRCWAFWKTHGVTSPSPNSLLVSASCLRLFPFTFKCLVALVGVLRLTLSTFVSPFFSVHFSPSACAFVFLLSPFTSLLFCSSIYRIRLLFWLSLSILPQLIDICLRFVPNYLPIGSLSFACLLWAGSEDFGSHPSVSQILPCWSPRCCLALGGWHGGFLHISALIYCCCHNHLSFYSHFFTCCYLPLGVFTTHDSTVTFYCWRILFGVQAGGILGSLRFTCRALCRQWLQRCLNRSRVMSAWPFVRCLLIVGARFY